MYLSQINLRKTVDGASQQCDRDDAINGAKSSVHFPPSSSF